MFDANARYLPEGTKFFVDVMSIKPTSTLAKVGIKKDDVLFCTMMDEDALNPRVTIHHDTDILVIHRDEFYEYWLVFAGFLDENNELQGFIDESSKIKAQTIMDKPKHKPKCDCPCHQKGVTMMHCFPCC